MFKDLKTLETNTRRIYFEMSTVELQFTLTHQRDVLNICVSKLGNHWFREWLVTFSVSRHHLNQCPREKMSTKFEQNYTNMMDLKMSSAKYLSGWPGPSVLIVYATLPRYMQLNQLNVRSNELKTYTQKFFPG